MATTPYTEEDKKLLACLPKCQEQLRKQIDVGRPYVWELRLSLEQFYILETAIADSISQFFLLVNELFFYYADRLHNRVVPLHQKKKITF